MGEDAGRGPGRPTAEPPDSRSGAAAHGSMGPADPHADPVTDPSMRPVERYEPGSPAPRDDAGPGADPADTTPPAGPVEGFARSRMSGLWIGMIFSAIVLLFLLIFILQNPAQVQISFLGATGTLPTGVALLLAAIAGVLLVAIPGSIRILQLRGAARRGTRRKG
jgi:uncharacterized integral membrane protein